MELEDLPVAIPIDAEAGGIDLRDVLKLAREFADVHEPQLCRTARICSQYRWTSTVRGMMSVPLASQDPRRAPD